MEPVTHVLTGVCLARAIRSNRVVYATAAMAIAAELPDVDVLWGLRGPIAGFQHHRGVTHTVVGVIFEAAFLLGCWFAVYRWRTRRKPPRQPGEMTQDAQVRWIRLYLGLLLALLSHLWLDYTNSYGLRPFFPFFKGWMAGSFVFIVDPLLLLILGGGLALPWFFRLIDQEVRGGRVASSGTGWARAALIAVAAFWGLRFVQHNRAVALVAAEVVRAPAPLLETEQAEDGEKTTSSAEVRPLLLPVKTLATPDPFNPWKWYGADDFGPVLETYEADTRIGVIRPERLFHKPPPSAALMAAKGSRIGRVYLDWSEMPLISILPAGGASDASRTVLLQDLRFLGASPWGQRGSTPPMSGEVVLNKDNQVLEQALDGRSDP